MKLKYQDGFKYQTMEDFKVWTSVYPGRSIENQFVSLFCSGLLQIKSGYSWDGASSLAIDTKNIMRGSLVHDALYQFMRAEQLDRKRWRKQADREFKRICREDGMSRFRAWYILRAVRRFAAFAADPASRRVTLETP